MAYVFSFFFKLGIELPHWSRGFLLGSYVRTFGCNMAEAEVEDIYQYKYVRVNSHLFF